MISQRNLLWLVPLALLVTFPLWRIPLASFLTPRGGYDPAYADVDTETHNFTMDTVRVQQIHSGIKSAEIRAENARTGDKPDEYVMTKVDTDIYDKEGAITNITADRGLYNIETKQLTLIDNVVINKTKDKQSLYTDLLYYDDDKRTVWCPGATRLVAEDAEINGGSLRYEIDTGQYEIGGRVRSVIEGFSRP
jgi:LPS export ABC transporter protein LptC